MTDNQKDHRELFDSLAFLGEITASVTHELNNVLGTIEQVSGLTEDLAATEVAQQSGIADRLNDVVDRIARQSARGSSLIKRLNHLAHLTDRPIAEFDLIELLENILALSERFAKMRKVSLNVTGLDQKILLSTSPLLVTQAVYAVFRGVLAEAIPGEALSIRVGADGLGGTITFEADCGDQVVDSAPYLDRVDQLMASLGGRLEASKDNERNKVVLHLPTGG